MKSIKSILVIAVMTGLIAGMAVAAQAETMYAGWIYAGSGTKTSVVKAYSTTDGADLGTLSGFDYSNYYIQGMAASPVNSNLYVTLYKATTPSDYRIVVLNRDTGALVNGNLYSTTNNAIRPITFDAAGNMYFGLACYAPGTDTYRGRIVKIESDGTVDEYWGNPADTVYSGGIYASDLEIRGGYLYAAIAHDATNKTKGAVVRYDLSGTTNVDPELMTDDIAGAPAYSLTFGPDGSLYTVGNNSHNVVGKWTWNSSTELYDSFTSITPTGCLYPQDVDYSDGFLYITDKQAPRTVRKYDLDTETWSNVCQYPASGTATGWMYGWVAFAPVPEPSTLALLACGLLGLLAYAWRKRK